MAALLSWIIMYVGSFAAKRFFPYHSYSLDKSLYKPGGVSPIDGKEIVKISHFC